MAVTDTAPCRAGKGEGYSDIEYAILRELGHDASGVPVATTVNDVQVVNDFPIESNDLPLTVIATPRELSGSIARRSCRTGSNGTAQPRRTWKTCRC